MNDISKDVFGIPELIDGQVDVLSKRIKEEYSDEKKINSINQIILTGCGDSFFAGKATQYFFNKITDIPTIALPSMEAGRYHMMDMSLERAKQTLQIAVSVSGNPPRTIEAAQIAANRGADTIAITANPESALAGVSNTIIECGIAPIPSIKSHIPGIRTYNQSLLAEYLLSIHIAEIRGRISANEAEKLRGELKKTSQACQSTIEASNSLAKKLAEDIFKNEYFLFVSSGFNRATADFLAAKIIEAAGLISFGQDTEEWSHLQYFECIKPETPTFFIDTDKRGHNRIDELLKYLKHIGRYTIVISSIDDSSISEKVDFVLPVTNSDNEYFMPLINHIPGTLFTGYLAEELDLIYFREDHPDYKKENGTKRDSPSRDGLTLDVSDLN